MTSHRRSDVGGEGLRVAVFRAVRALDAILPPMLFELFVEATSRMRAARLAKKRPELLGWAEIAARKVGGIDAARALRESLMSEWRVAAAFVCRDRFSEHRWRRRLLLTYATDGERADAKESDGCILGFLHSTGYRLLPAVLAMETKRLGLLRYKEMGRDERVGALCSGRVSQFGQSRYRAAVKHVSTGGTLLVSADHSKRGRVPLTTRYGVVWGALGAARIADLARASVRPVGIREVARRQFEVTVQQPIPMTDSVEERMTAVWHALEADVKGSPPQWSQELMRCLVGPDLP